MFYGLPSNVYMSPPLTLNYFSYVHFSFFHKSFSSLVFLAMHHRRLAGPLESVQQRHEIWIWKYLFFKWVRREILEKSKRAHERKSCDVCVNIFLERSRDRQSLRMIKVSTVETRESLLCSLSRVQCFSSYKQHKHFARALLRVTSEPKSLHCGRHTTRERSFFLMTTTTASDGSMEKMKNYF